MSEEVVAARVRREIKNLLRNSACEGYTGRSKS